MKEQLVGALLAVVMMTCQYITCLDQDLRMPGRASFLSGSGVSNNAIVWCCSCIVLE